MDGAMAVDDARHADPRTKQPLDMASLPPEIFERIMNFFIFRHKPDIGPFDLDTYIATTYPTLERTLLLQTHPWLEGDRDFCRTLYVLGVIGKASKYWAWRMEPYIYQLTTVEHGQPNGTVPSRFAHHVLLLDAERGSPWDPSLVKGMSRLRAVRVGMSWRREFWDHKALLGPVGGQIRELQLTRDQIRHDCDTLVRCCPNLRALTLVLRLIKRDELEHLESMLVGTVAGLEQLEFLRLDVVTAHRSSFARLVSSDFKAPLRQIFLCLTTPLSVMFAIAGHFASTLEHAAFFCEERSHGETQEHAGTTVFPKLATLKIERAQPESLMVELGKQSAFPSLRALSLKRLFVTVEVATFLQHRLLDCCPAIEAVSMSSVKRGGEEKYKALNEATEALNRKGVKAWWSRRIHSPEE